MSHDVRFAAESLLSRYLKAGSPKPLPMWAFLGIPIQERLILLCLLDHATHPEIKAALPFAKDPDIRLTSDRMVVACDSLQHYINNPTDWIYGGPDRVTGDLSLKATPFPFADRLAPQDTEWQLNNIFFPATAALLFGPCVSTELHALGLRSRVIGYLKVVEMYESNQIEALLKCSGWQVKQSMKRLREVIR